MPRSHSCVAIDPYVVWRTHGSAPTSQACDMTFQEEISALNDRIAKVESDRDTWRAAGQQGQYLEAFFLLGALEALRFVDTLSGNAFS
jgi:hypothetical protein